MSKRLRSDHGLEYPKDAPDYGKLEENAEVTRLCCYYQGACSRVNATYTAASLRTDLVAQMRKARAVIGDEKLWVPKEALGAMMKTLWSGGVFGAVAKT